MSLRNLKNVTSLSHRMYLMLQEYEHLGHHIDQALIDDLICLCRVHGEETAKEYIRESIRQEKVREINIEDIQILTRRIRNLEELVENLYKYVNEKEVQVKISNKRL